MEKSAIFSRFAHKLRIPADIVHIVFPVYCWALVAFRWSGLWLTEPWMTAVIALYYVMAAAYLFFTFFTRVRVVGIVGLFIVIAACIFVWVPHNWVFALLLIPAFFKAFKDKKDVPTAIAFTIVVGLITLIFVCASLLLSRAEPYKYAYHPSPVGGHVALELANSGVFFNGTDVVLYRINGSLLIIERVLYLGDYVDYGDGIEWLDQSTIFIYGETMDAFRDPIIHNYSSSF